MYHKGGRWQFGQSQLVTEGCGAGSSGKHDSLVWQDGDASQAALKIKAIQLGGSSAVSTGYGGRAMTFNPSEYA